MTDDDNEITTDELEWDEAVVQEGRQPGAVVSVRLDANETARLRALAQELNLNLSQVLRRALTAFDAEAHPVEPVSPLRVMAFTYGTAPLVREQAWRLVGARLTISLDERSGSGDAPPTWTEPSRIVERLTT